MPSEVLTPVSVDRRPLQDYLSADSWQSNFRACKYRSITKARWLDEARL